MKKEDIDDLLTLINDLLDYNYRDRVEPLFRQLKDMLYRSESFLLLWNDKFLRAKFEKTVERTIITLNSLEKRALMFLVINIYPIKIHSKSHDDLTEAFKNIAYQTAALSHIAGMSKEMVDIVASFLDAPISSDYDLKNCNQLALRQALTTAFSRFLRYNSSAKQASLENYFFDVDSNISNDLNKFLKLAFQRYIEFYPRIISEKKICQVLRHNLEIAVTAQVGNAFLSYAFRTLFYQEMEKLGERKEEFSPRKIEELVGIVTKQEESIAILVSNTIKEVNKKLKEEEKTNLLNQTEVRLKTSLSSLIAENYKYFDEIHPDNLSYQISSFLLGSLEKEDKVGKSPFNLFKRNPVPKTITQDLNVILYIKKENKKILVTQHDMHQWIKNSVSSKNSRLCSVD